MLPWHKFLLLNIAYVPCIRTIINIGSTSQLELGKRHFTTTAKVLWLLILSIEYSHRMGHA